MGGALRKLSGKKRNPTFDSLGGPEQVMLTKMAFSALLEKYYRGDVRTRKLKSQIGEITTHVINNSHLFEEFSCLYAQVQHKASSGGSILEIEKMITDFQNQQC